MPSDSSLDTCEQSDIFVSKTPFDEAEWSGQLWLQIDGDDEEKKSRNKRTRAQHAKLVRALKKMAHDAATLYGGDSPRAEKLRKRYEKVSKCPGYTRKHTTCGQASHVARHCDDVLCPWCMRRRQERLFYRYVDAVTSMSFPVLLTLTVRNVPHINKAYVRSLKQAFARMRRRKLFAEVIGGVWGVETTYSVTYGWHVHIHALMDSPEYIPQAAISSAWRKTTAKVAELQGGGYVVDIRKADAKGLQEVLKYAAKGSDLTDSPARIEEYTDAVGGTRNAGSWGSMRGFKLEDEKPERSECEHDEYECPWCESSGGEWEFVQYGLPEGAAVYKNSEFRAWRVVLPRGSPVGGGSCE